MPASLAPSASVPATDDFIGTPTAGLIFGARVSDGVSLDTEPAASAVALGSALRSLSNGDAAAILEALSAQAAALSLILAADQGGAIKLPESLRAVVESASALPAFLGGSLN